MHAWVHAIRLSAAVAAFAVSFATTSAQDTDSRARPVQRLIIHYAEGDFALHSQRNLMKVLPPSDRLPESSTPGAWSGFWFELVAPDGTVLFRRLTENPIIRVVERPDPDDPANQPLRHEFVPSQRFFSLLVPRYPENVYPLNLVFYGSPLRPDAHAEPAAELGRVLVPFAPPPVVN